MSMRHELYNYELYHHGIKGMKWGVRRFQDKNGRLTKAGKKRYSDDSDGREEISEENAKRGLSDKQKKYIKVGAAVAATALVSYGSYKLYKSGAFDKYVDDGKNYLSKTGSSDILQLDISPVGDKIRNLSTETGLNLKKGISSITEDSKLSNPGYDPNSASWKNNCSHATMAYILRRMGLDVKAKPMSFDEEGGISFREIGQYFKGVGPKIQSASLPKGSTSKDYTDALTKQLLSSCGKDDKSCGLLRIAYGSGGHFLAWENSGGSIVFTNPQSDMDVSRFFNGMVRGVVSPNVSFARLDDLDINFRRIKDVVENA